MSKILSQLLDAPEPMFSLMVERLEKSSGHQAVDVDLIAELLAKALSRMRQLGLDPVDTTSRELYASLLATVKLHDKFIADHLGIHETTDVHEVMDRVRTAVEKMRVPKQAWVLKQSVLKRLLKACPPKQVMKYLGYRSVDSLLKRESPIEIFAAARFLEQPAWHESFLPQYLKLHSMDFETRRIEIIRLDTDKWHKATKDFVHSNRHNIMHLKELGAVVLLPMPVQHMRGATLAIMLLVFHYMNEIRITSAYLKLHQVRAEFGEIAARTFIYDPGDHVVIANQKIHWRVVQRYYGLQSDVHPEVFEPHVMPDDIAWRKAEDILYRLEPALHFWHGMEYVGMMSSDGPVSFNLTDVAISYANGLPYEKRIVGNFRRALSDELFVRYLGQPIIERQILAQLNNEMVDPALVALSRKGNR